MNASALQELTAWLIEGAPSITPVSLLSGTCERLVAAGLPLWRVGAFVKTLHPDAFGRSFIWRPGAEVTVGTATYDMLDSPEFTTSPLAMLHSKVARLNDEHAARTRRTARISSAVSMTTMGVEELSRILRRSRASGIRLTIKDLLP